MIPIRFSAIATSSSSLGRPINTQDGGADITSHDISIRKAEPVDFAQVAAMHYPVWRRSWAGMITPTLLDALGSPTGWVTDNYPQCVNRPGWSMWIAQYNGEILGMTIFGPDTEKPHHLQIDALYIAEENQRLGIGSRLLNKALQANSSDDVILWCAQTNTKGRRFYEKNNFHADGRTFGWEPLGVIVPHLGYRFRLLRRSNPN